MTNIDEFLKASAVSRTDIEQLILQGKKIEAIKVVHDACGLDLRNSKNLVDAIESKQSDINLDQWLPDQNLKVKINTVNGKYTVKIKKGDQPEKIVLPTDPEWEEVRKITGHNPEIVAYEKSFAENPVPYQQQRSSLYVDNEKSNWKTIIIAAAIATFILYLIFK